MIRMRLWNALGYLFMAAALLFLKWKARRVLAELDSVNDEARLYLVHRLAHDSGFFAVAMTLSCPCRYGCRVMEAYGNSDEEILADVRMMILGEEHD